MIENPVRPSPSPLIPTVTLSSRYSSVGAWLIAQITSVAAPGTLTPLGSTTVGNPPRSGSNTEYDSYRDEASRMLRFTLGYESTAPNAGDLPPTEDNAINAMRTAAVKELHNWIRDARRQHR